MATVNQVAYDFTCLSFAAQNLDISDGVNSISYGWKKEVSKIAGTRRKPYARTPGSGDFEDVEIELEEWAADALTSALGDKYSDVVFPLVCTYSHKDAPAKSDELIDCMIIGEKKNPKKGSDSCVVTFTLSIMDLKLNGKSPI